MSYKKWIYKYQYLTEEFEEIEKTSKEYIIHFTETFSSDESEEDNLTNKKELLPKRIPDNPGKGLFKALSKLFHPDRGGDEEKFNQISELYRNKDTIGLFLIAEENGLDVEKFIDKDLTKSFEESCSAQEDKIYKTQNSLAWHWGTAETEDKKLFLIKHFKEKHNLDYNKED